MLNGVSAARRKRLKPPASTITLRRRASPAWAPSAGPCQASDTGTQITMDPFRVTGEVLNWTGRPAEQLKAMLDRLAYLKQQGVEAIE